MAKKKNNNTPLLYRFADGLRPRLEKHKGHRTLTGLLNDVLVAWVEKEERKNSKP
ncbi:MAG: hypothetical protein ABI599_05040 [Flavobacteriales bacterium]